MYQNIQEYIKLSKEERQKHLRLNEECLILGGRRQSSKLHGLLAYLLKTTMPEENKWTQGNRICLCHACNNSLCSNPYHLYWGTVIENNEDTRASGKWRTPYELTVKKHGKEKARSLTHDPQKDSIWITNPITKESKKIKSYDIIPDGWQRGRLLEYSTETKKRISKGREKRLGKNNGRFGTHYITNGSENRLIKSHESLPDGWKYGRVQGTMKNVTCNPAP